MKEAMISLEESENKDPTKLVVEEKQLVVFGPASSEPVVQLEQDSPVGVVVQSAKVVQLEQDLPIGAVEQSEAVVQVEGDKVDQGGFQQVEGINGRSGLEEDRAGVSIFKGHENGREKGELEAGQVLGGGGSVMVWGQECILRWRRVLWGQQRR